MPPPESVRTVVIDTQSLLDWLVFRDPGCADWARLLDGRAWQWVYTPALRAEFDFVAAKGFGERWPVPVAHVAAMWAAHAHEVTEPAPLGAGRRLACSDPDDQKFIDLAIALPAHTLVSRDKALLKLARRAAAHGVRVCRPADWPGA